jgi:hypothetical protein
MDENRRDLVDELTAERYGQGRKRDVEKTRAFAVPLMVACPWCAELLPMTLSWWVSGSTDVWGTGQISLHVCAVGGDRADHDQMELGW